MKQESFTVVARNEKENIDLFMALKKVTPYSMYCWETDEDFALHFSNREEVLLWWNLYKMQYIGKYIIRLDMDGFKYYICKRTAEDNCITITYETEELR